MTSILARRNKHFQEWKENCPKQEYIGDITMEQVMQHRTNDDCWVIVKGDVYNITPFLSVHIGGTRCITDKPDMTKSFMNFHRGQHLDLIEHLKIGRLVTENQ